LSLEPKVSCLIFPPLVSMRHRLMATFPERPAERNTKYFPPHVVTSSEMCCASESTTVSPPVGFTKRMSGVCGTTSLPSGAQSHRQKSRWDASGTACTASGELVGDTSSPNWL